MAFFAAFDIVSSMGHLTLFVLSFFTYTWFQINMAKVKKGRQRYVSHEYFIEDH
ncbi:hypothetical protein KSF_079700 [Reticulibacter mediterranei]|uniref:Uncharacterized protein n=1 Tax=Reticulibacter mediterranei TaxID=2778369 RepID=A0A8J3N860_9CHLR|nr:hypothetical protein KSF_079700 [Reticulibacter mediterranei]